MEPYCCPVDGVWPIRITPTLFSIVMVVPNGFDSSCTRARIFCAIAGGAVFGTTITIENNVGVIRIAQTPQTSGSARQQ